MNKIQTFFTAPITALFYPPVYKDAVRSSASRGVLYSLYLAGLSVVLLTIIFSVKIVPQADAFADWVKTNMPVLIWTPAGLSLENGQTTATLVHPQYGTIVVFDATKTSVTEADMGKAYVFVTASKFFVRRSGQLESRDITGSGMRPGQQLPPKVRITGDIAVKMYQNIKKTMMFIVPAVLFVFFSVFFLIANLFYSLAGLLFNLMRVEKLGYAAIFNLACFATTAAVMLTGLRVLIPLRVLALPPVFGILINLVYMFVAFKITDVNNAKAKA